MTAADFEISANLRARRLSAHVPPEVEIQAEGEHVVISSRERRGALPDRLEPGGTYRDVDVEKELVGDQPPDHARDGSAAAEK